MAELLPLFTDCPSDPSLALDLLLEYRQRMQVARMQSCRKMTAAPEQVVGGETMI